MESKVTNKQEELTQELRAAADAYTNGTPVMSDTEYNIKEDELRQMEEESGISLPGSPVSTVGAEPVAGSGKVVHEFPALSLDKVNDGKEGSMKTFVDTFGAGNETVLMWKLDGLTGQATYENGSLSVFATRGNGQTGDDITGLALSGLIKELPLSVKTEEKLVVRGELVMSYGEFDRINAALPADGEKFKNPRNLASGTIQSNDPQLLKERQIEFKAFRLVHKDKNFGLFSEQMEYLAGEGFSLVPYKVCIPYSGDEQDLEENMRAMERDVEKYPFPVDGLVAILNDRSVETLPGTGHHCHRLNGFAFKWEDVAVRTTVRNIVLSVGRTGYLTPVIEFDPVELYGTTVQRCTGHNFSFLRQHHVRVGDAVEVTKANMIIPALVRSASMKGRYGIEDYQNILDIGCSCCGSQAVLKTGDNGVETLWCENPDCQMKLIRKFVHFCERDCMNVVGLSETTIEKFVEKGWLKRFADLYHLDDHMEEIVSMEGFGQKKWDNLWAAIQASRKTSFIPFIHALGIPNIGKGQAKLLAPVFGGDVIEMFKAWKRAKGKYDYTTIEGIGPVLSGSMNDWEQEFVPAVLDPKGAPTFTDREREVADLMKEIQLEVSTEKKGDALKGLTFVITGALTQFPNRDALKAYIESLGGKVSGSVSKKTSFLISNEDKGSSKSKKAAELGVTVITEDQFIEMYQQD